MGIIYNITLILIYLSWSGAFTMMHIVGHTLIHSAVTSMY